MEGEWNGMEWNGMEWNERLTRKGNGMDLGMEMKEEWRPGTEWTTDQWTDQPEGTMELI